MRLKKNVFGYINFSLGTLIMSAFLYVMIVSLFRFYEEEAGKRIYVMGVKLSNIGGLCLVLLFALLFFLISFIKSKIIVAKFKGAGLISGLVYWFSFAFLLSYGVYVRVSCLKVLRQWVTIENYTTSVDKPGYWQKLLDLFYGKSVVFDNFFHKAYTYISALFLRIFGDSLSVPVVFNIVLYMLSAVLLYFSVKFIFGGIPALFVLAALMLSQTPVAYLFEIAGFNLYFFTLSLFLFLVTYFLDVYTKTKPVMCYIVSSVTVIAAIVLNHFIYKPFEFVIAFDLSILNFRPAEHLYVSIAITVFALFAFLSFLKNKEDEISFANILLIVLLLILMFDYSSNNTYFFTILTFCILAGIGFDNLLFKNYKTVTSDETLSAIDEELSGEMVLVPNEAMDVTEALPATEEEAEVPISEMIPEEVAASLEDETPLEEETPLDEELGDTGVITVSNLVGQINAPAPEESEPKEHVVPERFETPLPMPKKHVKKTFEYAIEPSSDLMKYDIEISQDDDFDIK